MYSIVYVDETRSTNTLMASQASGMGHGTVLAARSQTAGRGQRGNSWEAEPGMNLTFSVLLRPAAIEASRQFEISQSSALSIAAVLRDALGTDEILIKWPNDIYYRDLKICGTLIENTLSGSRIDRSILGIGINVNQSRFLSDAPNPVSMRNITGREYDLDALLERFAARIMDDFDGYERAPDPRALTERYTSMLWRGQGFWPYRDLVRGDAFDGRVVAVGPMGHLTLETAAGELRTFAFKEVASVL